MVLPLSRTTSVLPAILLLIVASLGSPASGAVAAGSPELRLRPNDGPPGIAILARGRDFTPRAAGTVLWDTDGSELGTFVADESGDFEVEIAIPSAPAGIYTVTAQAGDESATDDFAIESSDDATVSTTPADSSVTPPAVISESIASQGAASQAETCPSGAAREVDVSDAAELNAALTDAQPGDLIVLADGVYPGTYVASNGGATDERIWLCGSRDAVIDGGDFGNGYGLHITADFWTVHGITVTNALKGIMLDGANFTVLEQLAVHTIGHEGIHFRSHSADNIIQDSEIHDTGLKRDKFGEGVYIGSAVSNWGKYSGGAEDRGDRNQVLRNRIWNTTAESIDIKEGTTGGLIEGNVFDGSGLSGADSWVDLKGNGYTVRANRGANSPEDGFQTHVINDMSWGQDNTFDANDADVNGSGFGFYILDAETSNNTVLCSNEVAGADSGFANVACT